MRTRPLGNTGLRISELCFGTWEIGGLFWGPVDATKARDFLHLAFDAGVNAYDLADVYGNGRSECLVGRAFAADHRDRVVLITKAGYLPGVDSAQFLYDEQVQCFDARYLTGCLEMSLRRLETDHVDVFLLHDPPLKVVRRAGVWNTLRRLKQQGKARFVGISGNAETAVAAIRQGAEVVELPYNLVSPQAESELLPVAAERGVGVLARSPFASGMLLRKGKDAPSKPYRFLARRDRPLTEAAIKYVLSHPAVSAVVSGMMKPAELRKNLKACGRPLLTRTELKRVAVERAESGR